MRGDVLRDWDSIDAEAERVFGRHVPQSRRVQRRDDREHARREFDKLFRKNPGTQMSKR